MTYYERYHNYENAHFRPRRPMGTAGADPRGRRVHVTSTDMQRQFGQCIYRVQHDHKVLIVMRTNLAIIALITPEELARLRAAEEQLQLLLASIHDGGETDCE